MSEEGVEHQEEEVGGVEDTTDACSLCFQNFNRLFQCLKCLKKLCVQCTQRDRCGMKTVSAKSRFSKLRKEKSSSWSIRFDPDRRVFLMKDDSLRRYYSVPRELHGTKIQQQFNEVKLSKVEFEEKMKLNNRTENSGIESNNTTEASTNEIVTVQTAEEVEGREEEEQDFECVRSFFSSIDVLSPPQEEGPVEEEIEEGGENEPDEDGQNEENQGDAEGERRDESNESEERRRKKEQIDQIILKRSFLLEILPDTLFEKEDDWNDIKNLRLCFEGEDPHVRHHGHPVRFDNIRIGTYIHRGVYSPVYTFTYPVPTKCRDRIHRILSPRIFVSKFYFDRSDFGQGDIKLILEKDCPRIGYHKNVTSIIHNNLEFQLGDDGNRILNNNFKQMQRTDKEIGEVTDGIVIMKHYPWTLESYLRLREYKQSPLSVLEICYILKGILEGVQFLNQSRICHRDLHFDNIFMDVTPRYTRILIGDFGCCINFNLREGEKEGCMVIKSTDQDREKLLKDEDGYITACDGLKVFDPPEFRNVDVGNEESWELDYEHCDMYLVGKIGSKLLQRRDMLFKANPTDTRERNDEKLDDLEYLTGIMKEEDPKQRVSYRIAIPLGSDSGVLTSLQQRNSGVYEKYTFLQFDCCNTPTAD